VKEKDAIVDSKEQQIVLYVEKDDGSYGTVRTGAYMITEHGDDFRQKVADAEAQCRDKLPKKQISPIGFFITLFGMVQDAMAIPDVAKRVGLRASAVRKHMEPKGYESVTVGQLKKYADVFGVPLPALLDPLAKPPVPAAGSDNAPKPKQ
jgi:hypothetical protein